MQQPYQESVNATSIIIPERRHATIPRGPNCQQRLHAPRMIWTAISNGKSIESKCPGTTTPKCGQPLYRNVDHDGCWGAGQISHVHLLRHGPQLPGASARINQPSATCALKSLKHAIRTSDVITFMTSRNASAYSRSTERTTKKRREHQNYHTSMQLWPVINWFVTSTQGPRRPPGSRTLTETTLCSTPERAQCRGEPKGKQQGNRRRTTITEIKNAS